MLTFHLLRFWIGIELSLLPQQRVYRFENETFRESLLLEQK